MQVAFQGVYGAYSDVAAKKFFGARCMTLPLDTFDEVFEAVERRRCERGVIPIENSLAGSIHQNYDLLLSHQLHIVGEIHLRIEHALMCHPSSSFKQLTSVRSHPQALAQCNQFFRDNPTLTPLPFFDTAGAAQSLAEERNLTCGAIASEHAATRYKLRILKRNLESKSHNFTRFLVISKSAWRRQRRVRTKSSIVFEPASNQTGVLFQSLGVFYVRNIDLMKIESRPDPQKPFEYLFYLDLEGSPYEHRVAEAFEHLREKTKFFRLLGAYPMGRGDFYGAA